MNENPNQPALAPSPTVWRERSHELREAEWKAHKDCLQAAQYALQTIRGQKCTVNDVAKLLDLASKLGRLASGLPTDHTPASIHDDRAVRVEISAAIKKIYSEPMESLLARMQPTLNVTPANTSTPDASPNAN